MQTNKQIDVKQQYYILLQSLAEVLCPEQLGQLLQKLEMWASAQHDGRPAEYRWRPLFNPAKFG